MRIVFLFVKLARWVRLLDLVVLVQAMCCLVILLVESWVRGIAMSSCDIWNVRVRVCLLSYFSIKKKLCDSIVHSYLATVHCNNHLQHPGPVHLEVERRKVAQEARRSLLLAYDWSKPQEHRKEVRKRCFHGAARALLGQNSCCEKVENTRHSRSRHRNLMEVVKWEAGVVQGIVGTPD